ncbi:unnamed protein product, partial [Polarella glacialis]
ELIAELREKGYQVVLISSGAVGMGCIKLGLKQKPSNLRTKQAVAAAGQSQLMRMYEDLFGTVGVQVAQLLLSQSDFLEKERWSNVKSTIYDASSLSWPIINENDSTNTAGIRFGDNDNLAALTAVQLEADGLFLFTDVDNLFTANPRVDPDAKPLRLVREPWALEVDTRAEGSGMGTGGMATKILAARTASASGIPCCMIHGAEPKRSLGFLDFAPPGEGEQDRLPATLGTYFMAMDVSQTVGDTRRWILSLPTPGELVVDDGAARALGAKNSLLPAGVLKFQGVWKENEAVKICYSGNEIARGVINFSSDDLSKVLGKNSSEFEELLGYASCAEACYRNNIILTTPLESLLSIEVVPKPRLSRGYSEVRGQSLSIGALDYLSEIGS